MSYVDKQKRSNTVSLAAVAVTHVAIGYALISGLALNVVKSLPTITSVRLIPLDKAPEKLPPPPPQQKVEATRLPQAEPPLVTNPYETTVDTTPIQTQTATQIETVEIAKQPSLPPASGLAQEARPKSNRAGWVTADDYPPAAVRDGVEGSVGIRVTVSATGRATGCEVTASSGSTLLDQATCQTYMKRARFIAALDDSGAPTTSMHADRITWRIPR